MEKETYAEENITCPNCEKVATHDSWERKNDDGEEICDYCGAEFIWTRDVSVTYSSELKTPTQL
jgi:ssDNA-binding Zn-finger/Zn-ribbon topoisomerase 1